MVQQQLLQPGGKRSSNGKRISVARVDLSAVSHTSHTHVRRLFTRTMNVIMSISEFRVPAPHYGAAQRTARGISSPAAEQHAPGNHGRRPYQHKLPEAVGYLNVGRAAAVPHA